MCFILRYAYGTREEKGKEQEVDEIEVRKEDVITPR